MPEGGSGPKGNRRQPRRGGPRRPPRPSDGRSSQRDGKRRRVPPAIRIGVDVGPDDVVARSAQFRVVEVDAGLEILTERVVGPWVDRTPEGFVIDVRAHRLFTQHPVPVETLWPEVRDALGALGALPAPGVRRRPLGARARPRARSFLRLAPTGGRVRKARSSRLPVPVVLPALDARARLLGVVARTRRRHPARDRGPQPRVGRQQAP